MNVVIGGLSVGGVQLSKDVVYCGEILMLISMLIPGQSKVCSARYYRGRRQGRLHSMTLCSLVMSGFVHLSGHEWICVVQDDHVRT
jgi:hypothetical protein